MIFLETWLDIVEGVDFFINPSQKEILEVKDLHYSSSEFSFRGILFDDGDLIVFSRNILHHRAFPRMANSSELSPYLKKKHYSVYFEGNLKKGFSMNTSAPVSKEKRILPAFKEKNPIIILTDISFSGKSYPLRKID